MNKPLWTVLLAVAGWLGATSAHAQGSLIGFVKTLSPEAQVWVDGQPIRAGVGMPLQKGFRLKTGDSGSMGITLRDNTMLSFGPNTEFLVDEYLFEPAKGELSFKGSILRGTMQYVSGVIAKLKADAVFINTPKGIVGMRGTHVLIKVDES